MSEGGFALTTTKRAIKWAASVVPIGLSAGLFALALSGSAGATSAADDAAPLVEGLSWSRDGGIFQASLPEPILGPEQRLAPGQAQRERLWVRNDTDADADLVLGLRLEPGAPARDAVLEERALTLAAQLVGDEWRSMRVQQEARSIFVGTLEAGAAVPVTVLVALSPGSDVPIAGSDLHLDVAVEDSPDGDDSFMMFQQSGGAMSLVSLLVPVGLLLVAGGALALNRSHPSTARSGEGPAPVRAIAVDDFTSYASGVGR